MRILQLMQHFQTGGLERMVFSLAEGLKEKNIHCEVASYLSDGPLREALDDMGIGTHVLQSTGSLDPKLSLSIYNLIKMTRVDLVHTHHIGPYLYAAVPAKIAGIPIVHTEHSREFYGDVKMDLIGRSMDLCSTVVCVADEVAAYRSAKFGKTPMVIDNGVNVPSDLSASKKELAREKLGIGPSDFVVGCVARISPEKDHGTLLLAFKTLLQNYPDAKLVLVGGALDEAYFKQVAFRIGELGLDRKVFLLGNRNDIDTLYPGFDVIALSSEREGLPLSLLEGMAHQMPAVATAVGGIPKLLEGGGGLLAPAKDPGALAEALGVYASDAKRRQADGTVARALIEKEYSKRSMVDAYLRIYTMLCGDKGACEPKGACWG